MNDQRFSGDPSTAIRKSTDFGRDDRVRVGARGGQHLAFFQVQSFMSAAFQLSRVIPTEQSERRDLIDIVITELLHEDLKKYVHTVG